MRLALGLVHSLPVLGALLVVAGANVRRAQRERQVLVPPVAALYALLAIAALYFINDRLGAASGQSVAWASVAENVIVVSAFVIIKLILRPIGKRLMGRGAGEALVSRIYSYEPQYDRWFVSVRMSNLRSFFRWMYWASVALALAFLTLADAFPDWGGFAAAAAPAIAALVIGEIYFAIDGFTLDEYQRDILGEADRSRRVTNFGPLRRILKEVFGERVLTDGVHLSSNAALESDFTLGHLSRSDDPAERLVGTYFARLRAEREDVDTNLVEASVTLIKGTSVVISNPFYADLTTYLCLPAYYNLLQYRKILIIAGRESAVDDLRDWMDAGLESITGIPHLWKVEVLTALGREDLDVGILGFADAHNPEFLRNNDAFFSTVDYVILAEPARMISTGQLGLSLVLSRCSRQGKPTVAAFDGNHDGLVDALSHLLKVDLTEVIASSLPTGASSEMVWEADGPYLSSVIMPTISRYLGVGTEIAAIALKYQVRQVHWVGSDTFPVKDMMWIAGQYFAQINSFAELELSQEALGKALVGVTNPVGIKRKDAYFLIVEDEASNVFETVRRFATRANDMGFVNVISSRYLLRDYMVANRDLFLADSKAVPSIVPDFARTERNAILRLILTLTTFGVRADHLAQEFELIGWTVPGSTTGADSTGEPAIMATLRRAIIEHTGSTDVVIRRQASAGSALQEPQPDTYTVEGGPEFARIVKSLRAAYFFVEDEIADVNRIGSLLYGHVYQALLPGQFVTHDGKYYEVQRISADDFGNGVVLRRAADHIRGRKSYRQLRTYTVSDFRVASSDTSQRTVNDMRLTRCVATIEASSWGYLESGSRAEPDSGRRVVFDDVPIRRYANKSVLAITCPGIPEQVRITLAHLLNELFVTVFPYSHDYVRALTVDPEESLGDLLDTLNISDDSWLPAASDTILIVEDSMIDLGLTVAVERHLPRFLEIITDYLAWDATPVPAMDESPADEPFVPHFPDRNPPELPAKTRPWWRRLWPFGRTSAGSANPGSQAPGPSAESGNPVPVEDPQVAATGGDEVIPNHPNDQQDPSETTEEVPSVTDEVPKPASDAIQDPPSQEGDDDATQ